MKRCLAEGSERFALWVDAAVLANNLMVIAHHHADHNIE
jgi:transposase, IS5 family